jgi:hypothetical protein
MPHSLEEKNVLIVPLSLFIQFNKKMAGEKFANLFGKFFDDMFSCDEEMDAHNKFCENLLQKILTSQIVADFNLGKKTKPEFISELVNFLSLPSNESKDIEIEAAWNSLIQFDPESSETYYALIKLTLQGKSIYFVGNTNELHAEKILNLFAGYPYNKLSFLENLPNPLQALPLAISQVADSELDGDVAPQIGTIYFCLSYAYKSLIEQPQGLLTQLFNSSKPASGLLTHLKVHLNDMGKTLDDILLVNAYTKSPLTKKLALDTISKEEFYTDLQTLSASTTATARINPMQTDLHHTPLFSTSLSVNPPAH